MVAPAFADGAPDGTLVPGGQIAQMPPPPPPMMVNWSGFYVGVNVGADKSKFPGSVSVAPTPAGALPGSLAIPGSSIPLNTHVGGGGGIVGGGQLGYNMQFPSNWVFGGELDIRGTDTSSTTTLNTLPAGLTNFVPGDNFKASQSWNGSARAKLGYAMGSVLPYITGGVAFGDVTLRTNFIQTAAGGIVFPASRASASDTLVGWTAGAGIEIALSPNWSLGAEYRYADYGDTRLSLGRLTTVASPTAAATAAVSGRVGVQEHSLVAKVNYHFAPAPQAPAPMAMPAPPPAAPVVFIVFFDWDKDSITPEGMQIVQQAAAAYKSGAPVQIQVTGYTDRSGSPGYNQRLSERRANNVAKALAAQGVAKEQMIVSGRGENDNRVPTADGVREPQNRRVDIVAP
jgi:outer membrane protein OmpA-like peptidoglycan-associated protein